MRGVRAGVVVAACVRGMAERRRRRWYCIQPSDAASHPQERAQSDPTPVNSVDHSNSVQEQKKKKKNK